MDKISRAIEETGVSLEGITYWSISDTLDHNLERTNRKTFEQGLQRDVATTRYAGLYPDFSKEQEIEHESNQQDTYEVSDTTDKTKKNRLFSFIAKIVNKFKNSVKRKDIKMLPEVRQDIREKSNSRNAFLEGLRVSPEELAENAERQETDNIKIRQDKKDEPSLDD